HRFFVLARLFLVLLLGCHDRDGEHADHDHAEEHARAFTTFGERAELFIEIPTLVVGHAVTPEAHVTLLEGYVPAAEGRIALELSGGGLPSERFEAAPSEPGMFRPSVEPAHAGERSLAVVITRSDQSERHELGQVVVYPSAEAAEGAPPIEEPEGIAFLKPQQWRMDFAVERVTRRRLRPSFEAYGTLVPRAGGAVDVTAPLA